MNEKLSYAYDTYIGAAVSEIWQGIADGEMTKHYVYGIRLESALKKALPMHT
jgi:hypothetical protein